jgi:peptide/nickel transport system ATP-binding protein
MSDQLLEIRDLTKTYGHAGRLRQKTEVVALDDFNLSIATRPATITTVAGESGSGKTTLAKLILGFESLTSGQILFEGQDLSHMNHKQWRQYRRNVQAVFQDPYAVFNPFYRVEHVFRLIMRAFRLADDKQARRKMIEDALNVVGLRGEDVLRKYPHQLSGGQRQRIMMARAYMVKPKLIVADEPVSMVDASLRAAILDVMLRLRDEMEISFIYITHDLSTAYQIGDQIYILYQGATAECGATTEVIDHPKHPYVQLLVDSVPAPDPSQKWDTDIELPEEEELDGFATSGCRFYPRCPHRMEHCLTHLPPLYVTDQREHQASCFLYDDELLAEVRRETTGAEGQS